ncbi:MAG: tetratricopeptide repeat protein [Deltaproteobacteria bacterium]|nr:tetratricopeptide repeat protein [Deltaproteobacteria bacterium]
MTRTLPIALSRLAVALLAGLGALAAEAVDPPAAATALQPYVIPPGQEDLVTRMLTPDASWPAGVALQGAEITGGAVVASYTLGGGGPALRVHLRHKDAAVPREAVTGQFALATAGDATGWEPAARQALVASLVRQVAAHEGAFRWVAAAESAPAAPTAGAAVPSAPSTGANATALLGEAVDAARTRDTGRAIERALHAWDKAQALPAVERAWVAAGAAAVLRTVGHGEARARARAAVDLAAEVTVAEGKVARTRALFALGRDGDAAAGLHALAADTVQRQAACPLVESVADDLAATQRAEPAMALLRDWQTADPACAAVALAASRVARWAGIGPQALPMLERAARDHPKDVAVAIHLAHLYKELRRFDEALRILDALDFRGAHLDKALVLDITRVYLDVDDNARSLALHRQRSDADPSEPVSAFVVGTILHHTDHWAESNRYLARSEAAFAQEPRQFIYTGMNHYRIGNQAEAETRIERALRLGKSDPDIYYCRAVVRTRKAPDAALADLQTYLAMTAGSRETYAPKEAKVARMVEDLRGCRDARDVQQCLDLQRHLHTVRDWAPHAAAAMALLAVAVFVLRRRRRAAAGLVAVWLAAGALAPTVAAAADHAAVGDLRPTLQAPATLAAQWTWLSGLDRAQVAVSAVLIFASAGFFLPPRR